jgi:Mn2+/Fe2+ NRAMP family transporter
MFTGQGLAGALRKRFPRWVLVIAALALLAANTVNIAADLAGMAYAFAETFGWRQGLDHEN